MTKCLLSLVFLLACARLAYSKGPVDLILISGGGLNQSVEITDRTSLKAFDPWMGQFANWQQKAVVDVPCSRRSFDVLFYMKWPRRVSQLDRGDLKMIYFTRYCFSGSVGYVYLPGRSEPGFSENNGTIIRGDADGKWHVATHAWDSLLRHAVGTKVLVESYAHESSKR